MDQRWRPQAEIAPNCPRCDSSNTKFCYYNNYSLSQPRYFCKSCKRYWTKGGSLRKIPIGGGCRKSRRGKTVNKYRPDRSSFMGYNNNNPQSDQPDSSTIDDPFHHNSGGGSNIDLAVVFSNFLNPVGFVSEQPEPELSNSTNSLHTTTNNDQLLFQQGQFGFELDSDPTRFNGDHYDQGEKLMEDDLITGYGLEQLPFDGFDQDVLWSDTSMVTDFTWQPEQVQDGFEAGFDEFTSSYPNNILNW